jgi:hypothetical protein
VCSSFQLGVEAAIEVACRERSQMAVPRLQEPHSVTAWLGIGSETGLSCIRPALAFNVYHALRNQDVSPSALRGRCIQEAEFFVSSIPEASKYFRRPMPEPKQAEDSEQCTDPSQAQGQSRQSPSPESTTFQSQEALSLGPCPGALAPVTNPLGSWPSNDLQVSCNAQIPMEPTEIASENLDYSHSQRSLHASF